ncbi:MFS transporter [Actinoallomurus purpureus]|uniref:MFS transporter n=1 Tax=Actinoallomurus purpureus TaxID=478114 RepID=UPI002092DC6F|nr:MFS transporter [Actinoallomurus purpureus]MCO6005620.1 MFS transporter [Actinoallomurus purpureus]
MVQAPSSSGLARGLSVLRERNFRWFFVGQCTSMLGDGMVAPALAFAVLGLTGRAVDLGAVLAAGSASQVLFTLAGGVIADRLPRHALMLGSDLVRAVSQGLAATLLITGAARVWHLLIFQVVHGIAAALSGPAVAGLVQATTRPEQRQPANALRVLALSASLITGPAVAGILVVGAGPGWAIAADSATFAISAACLSRVRLRRTGDERARRFTRDLADGWREFRSRRWVWSVIVAASLVNLLYGAFSVLGPTVSARSFGGAGAWALISATFGAGCLGGGVIALCVRPRFPLRSGVAMMAMFACPTLALAADLTVAGIAVAAFCGGLVLMVFNTLWETALQQHIPATALSRVSAYEWAGAIACQPLGLALVAPVAGRLGLHATLWTAGTLQLLVVLTPLLFSEVRTLPSPPGDRAT